MELIDQLEQRLDMLLAEAATLRQENSQLKEALQRESASMQEEHLRLTRELEQERAARQAVTASIDSLLQKIDAAASGDSPTHAQPQP